MNATPHLPSTIEHLATDALIPYARNSRTHSPEQVAVLEGANKTYAEVAEIRRATVEA